MSFFLYFSFSQYSKKYLVMEENPFRKEGKAKRTHSFTSFEYEIITLNLPVNTTFPEAKMSNTTCGFTIL